MNIPAQNTVSHRSTIALNEIYTNILLIGFIQFYINFLTFISNSILSRIFSYRNHLFYVWFCVTSVKDNVRKALLPILFSFLFSFYFSSPGLIFHLFSAIFADIDPYITVKQPSKVHFHSANNTDYMAVTIRIFPNTVILPVLVVFTQNMGKTWSWKGTLSSASVPYPLRSYHRSYVSHQNWHRKHQSGRYRKHHFRASDYS